METGEPAIDLNRQSHRCGSGLPTYAAVDLGTHNCRMLVARPHGRNGFRVVRSYSKPVRLGEGLALSGALSEAAMARSLRALGACAQRIRRLGVSRVRSIATEACRRASNADAFVARVERETGLQLEPVTAADEARLTLAGCTTLLDPVRPRVLLFDIGGGSTEVSWIEQRPGRPPRVLGMLSLPLGVVSFAEHYGGDVIAPDRYAEMVARVRDGLAPLESEHRIGDDLGRERVQMIGTSGTVTTLAAAYLRLKRYDRARVDGIEVDFGDIAAVSAGLAASTWEERAQNPCIGPDRADLVIAGCAILQAVCETWPVGRLRVADRGIREGLLLSMMAEDGATRTGLPRRPR